MIVVETRLEICRKKVRASVNVDKWHKEFGGIHQQRE
jgi:hypothetical protein